MQKQTKWIGLVTAAHLIVDMCCACLISMLLFTDTECGSTCKLHITLQNPALYLLLYNFCAFALQMPIGYLTDRFCKGRTETAAAFGCLLVASSFLFSKIFALYSAAVIAAGTGNALFHVGAGVKVLKHADGKIKHAGIFVSSGALGLYIGKQLSYFRTVPFCSICICLLCLSAFLLYGNNRLLPSALPNFPLPQTSSGTKKENSVASFHSSHWNCLIILLLFTTVFLRSLMGTILSFPRIATLPGITLPLLLACGKALGGILADRFGICKTISVTLGMSAILFLLSQNAIGSIPAILLFQTTMPITLWLLYEQMPQNPGFAFGILTFGLFVGYLPYWFHIHAALCRPSCYAAIAFLSLVLLLCVLQQRKSTNREENSKKQFH